MPIRVQVPGHGIVEFPDGTPESEMRSALASLPNPGATATTSARSWGDTALDVGKGIVKGAVHSGLDLASMAAQSGLPGLSPTAVPAVMAGARAATPYRNDAQFAGGALETAAELAPGAVSLGRAAAEAVPALARRAGPVAVEVAGHLPVIGRPIRAVNALSKILGRVLEVAGDGKPAANAGGRLVQGKSGSIDSVLADALEELRAPESAPSVELPPQSDLPSGYTPRSSAPAYTPPEPAPASPQGRLVPGQPRPTVEQELSAALEDARKAQPTVTTPPPAELPPGYQPRTSTLGPRNYFLKSDAVAPTPAAASNGPRLSDLPASWQKMTAPPTLAPREIDGSGLAAAYQQELIRRGVKPSQAITMVNRNPNLPADVKAIIVKALETVARNKS